MAKTTEVRQRYGTTGVVIAPGERIRIDPSLRAKDGSILQPDLLLAWRSDNGQALAIASRNSDGTFDLQNDSGTAGVIEWFCTSKLEPFKGNQTQTGFGPNGADPSPAAPIPGPGTPTANLLYVDGRRTTGDGSFANPYPTEQEAFNYIESLLDAAVDNQYVINVIYPSDQPIIARCPFTHLVFGGMVSAFKQSAGLPIFITNATLASVATFLANNGDTLTVADTQYTDLVPDPALVWPNGVVTPVGSSVEGVRISRSDGDTLKCSMMWIIAGPGADPTTSPSFFHSLLMRQCFYVRNALIMEQYNVNVIKDAQIRQVRSLKGDHCGFAEDYDHNFDITQDRSIAPHNTSGYSILQLCKIGNLITRGTSTTNAMSCSVFANKQFLDSSTVVCRNTPAEDLIVTGSPNVDLLDCAVRDDFLLTAPVTPTVLLRGCHIGGGINLAAGGAKSVTMNGGSYMGALTDPDGVFVRNLGN